MRKIIIGIGVVCAMAVFFLVLQQSSRQTQTTVSLVHGLPWQIEKDDGHTRVFGLTIGKSSMADAAALLGDNVEVAIINDQQQNTALEMYASSFSSGNLTGSLIIVADVSAEEINELRKKLLSSKQYLETGSAKIELRFEQRQQAFPYRIKNITFIPVAPLTRDIIELRFGRPVLTLVTDKHVTHYLYPANGLNIIIDEHGRDFLQYMSREEMAGLQAGLEEQSRIYHGVRK